MEPSEPKNTTEQKPVPVFNRIILGVVALGVVLLLGATLFSKPQKEELPETETITALPFETSEGEIQTLEEYAGETLVVNFFASSCAPCRAELPDFEEVHQEVKDDVKFIGVNHDLNRETWKAFVQETNVTFETVFQPEQTIFKKLRGQGLPATAFISADGEIQEFFVGKMNKQLLEQKIENLHKDPK